MKLVRIKVLIILFTIFFLGLLLRLYLLSSVPAGLHYDEAQSGYNAYLILNTGKNLNGVSHPIDIDYFGDYRPAMISYLSMPFVKVLGLNIFSTRLASVVIGSLLILVAFSFGVLIFKNVKASLLMALFAGVSPMSIVFSRATTDGIIDVFFVLLGVLTLIWSIKNKSIVGLVLVYLFWMLSYFSYQTSRVMVPLIGLPIILLSSLEFRPKKLFFVLGFLPFVLYIIFPFLYYLPTPMGQGRFKQVSVFLFPEVQRDLNEQIREDGHFGSVLASRIFHNKIVGYTYDIVERYSQFISPQTILFSISQPDRYSVPHVGAISALEFIGFILAISYYIVRKNRPIFYLPIVLLLLAPIPSALTFEASPNFQRAIFMTPFWQIVAAFGLVHYFADKGKFVKIFSALVFLAMFVWQYSYFLHQYFIHQPARFSSIQSRNTEFKKEAQALKREVDNNKKIIISERGGPSIYYLFYNKILIGDAKVIKLGKYYTGNFSVDSIDYYDGECIGYDRFLNIKYDISIIFKHCPKPRFARLVENYYRSDGSMASSMYDFDIPVYHAYVQRYLQADSIIEKQLIEHEFETQFIK